MNSLRRAYNIVLLYVPLPPTPVQFTFFLITSLPTQLQIPPLLNPVQIVLPNYAQKWSQLGEIFLNETPAFQEVIKC